MSEPLYRSIPAFMALVLGCGVLIAATALLTRERIEDNRAARLTETLRELTGAAAIPGGAVDAAALDWRDDVAALCDGRALLRGSAAGYGGPIHWLAIAARGGSIATLGRLRISAHQETPGIVDFLDDPQQGWLTTLPGRSAAELARTDTVSGATITTRALRRSLAAALERPALGEPECSA